MRCGVFSLVANFYCYHWAYMLLVCVWSISPTFDMLQHNNMSVSVAEFFIGGKQNSTLFYDLLKNVFELKK